MINPKYHNTNIDNLSLEEAKQLLKDIKEILANSYFIYNYNEDYELGTYPCCGRSEIQPHDIDCWYETLQLMFGV